MASTSENRSVFLRSYCTYVLFCLALAFFLFFKLFPVGLPVAHRIDWYGRKATRGTFNLDMAKDDVDSRLRGAISDRGCAMVRGKLMRRARRYQKFMEASGEPRPARLHEVSSFPNMLISENENLFQVIFLHGLIFGEYVADRCF
jgi:hypothetical protein